MTKRPQRKLLKLTESFKIIGVNGAEIILRNRAKCLLNDDLKK